MGHYLNKRKCLISDFKQKVGIPEGLDNCMWSGDQEEKKEQQQSHTGFIRFDIDDPGKELIEAAVHLF